MASPYVYIPLGLHFQKLSSGNILLTQRENDNPMSHAYWEIEFTVEQWAEIVTSMALPPEVPEWLILPGKRQDEG